MALAGRRVRRAQRRRRPRDVDLPRALRRRDLRRGAALCGERCRAGARALRGRVRGRVGPAGGAAGDGCGAVRGPGDRDFGRTLCAPTAHRSLRGADSSLDQRPSVRAARAGAGPPVECGGHAAAVRAPAWPAHST